MSKEFTNVSVQLNDGLLISGRFDKIENGCLYLFKYQMNGGRLFDGTILLPLTCVMFMVERAQFD